MSVRRSSIRGTFFPDGVLNILRIFRTGGAKYSRIFCAGVQKIGDAKYLMDKCKISIVTSEPLSCRGFLAQRLITAFSHTHT